MNDIDIIILAAGSGTRTKSSIPKVLQPLAGIPLLQHVINTAMQVQGANIHVVVGKNRPAIQQYITQTDITWVDQAEQLGTGHAVLQAINNLNSSNTALILYGDVPLLQQQTLSKLIETAQFSNALAILTCNVENPAGYGRIIRDAQEQVAAIVEDKDATAEQLSICEINTGILSISNSKLQEWLPEIKNHNKQQEYYLTDIVKMATQDATHIKTISPLFSQEIQGVNTLLDLANLERFYQFQLANDMLLSGVYITDPNRIDIRGDISFGKDVSIDINTVLEGNVTIGNGVAIGANCIISNAIIGDNSTIKPNSIIENTKIGKNCSIGPFARLRPDTQLANNVSVGNYVEIKKSNIQENSKINHLAYIGDTNMGSNVNVGAGTITCNYDGQNKHTTTIKDNSFIGSNSSLVAPVVIGEKSTIGAGSTITKEVPENSLAVARSKQRNFGHDK